MVVVVIAIYDISFNTFNYDLHMTHAQLYVPTAPDVINTFNTILEFN